MTTLSISLPASLQSFVDAQVQGRGFATSSDYVSDLIRADQDRQQLRGLLLDGAASPMGDAVSETDFQRLRDRVRRIPEG